MSRQPEQGGPIRPPDVGYRVHVRHDGVTETETHRIHNLTVTARPTWRLLLAMRLAPPILRWLAAAMVLTLRAFPARVRPAVDVVVTLPSAP